MKALAAFAVVFFACLAYYGLALIFGVFQRFPIVHFIVAGLGVGALVWLVYETRSLGRLAALLLGVTVLGLFAWHTLVYSVYDSQSAAFGAGEDLGPRLASLEFPSHSGEPVPVWRSSDRSTLVVFYRGFW